MSEIVPAWIVSAVYFPLILLFAFILGKGIVALMDAYRDLCYKPVCHKCGGKVRESTVRRPWYCIEEHGRTEADWVRVTTLRGEVREWFRPEKDKRAIGGCENDE